MSEKKAKAKKQKEPKKIGRTPEIVTDSDRVERILNAIRLGLSLREACEYAGIGTTSYYEIKGKGEAGIQPYAAFTEQLKKALIERKVRLLGNLERHSETNWVVSAWRLERMFPEEFAKRVEHTGAGGGPIEGDLTVKWPELPPEGQNPDKE